MGLSLDADSKQNAFYNRGKLTCTCTCVFRPKRRSAILTVRPMWCVRRIPGLSTEKRKREKKVRENPRNLLSLLSFIFFFRSSVHSGFKYISHLFFFLAGMRQPVYQYGCRNGATYKNPKDNPVVVSSPAKKIVKQSAGPDPRRYKDKGQSCNICNLTTQFYSYLGKGKKRSYPIQGWCKW